MCLPLQHTVHETWDFATLGGERALPSLGPVCWPATPPGSASADPSGCSLSSVSHLRSKTNGRAGPPWGERNTPCALPRQTSEWIMRVPGWSAAGPSRHVRVSGPWCQAGRWRSVRPGRRLVLRQLLLPHAVPPPPGQVTGKRTQFDQKRQVSEAPLGKTGKLR